MKRAIVCVFAIFSATASSQMSPGMSIVSVASAPSGACTTSVWSLITTTALSASTGYALAYTCLGV